MLQTAKTNENIYFQTINIYCKVLVSSFQFLIWFQHNKSMLQKLHGTKKLCPLSSSVKEDIHVTCPFLTLNIKYDIHMLLTSDTTS